MRKEFTGRHMAAVLIIGLGIVVAVNMFMATMAARGFGGVVVENSYVASQNYNSWLEEAERQAALGWEAAISRDEDGILVVETNNVPQGAVVEAHLRRPLGALDAHVITLSRSSEGVFVSPDPIDQGRWTIRLHIAAAGEKWSVERSIQ